MKRLTMLLMAMLFMGSAMAQMDPMQPIPADPEVRTGRLDNGMSYYIRHNEKPKGQANFYILHTVGAMQENDAQQGLAHFLEHMAFNGSKNLPGKQMIEYLEKVGVKFGANLNAGTSWDYTQYYFTDVPTERQSVVDSALLILHDWSQFITLNPAEIDAERGVIQEELRTRDGAQWRSMMKMLQAIGRGSKYEHRNIIGHLEGLQTFKHQELVDFYHAWYRPEYQAVVVVGDIDVDHVENHIKQLMSDIPASPADAQPKEEFIVPDNEEPIVEIYTDPELQASQIQLYIKRPAIPAQINNTIYGEMLGILNVYITTMENARMEEIAMQADAPFLGGGMSSGSIGIINNHDFTTIAAMTQEGKLARGFEAIYTEVEKMRRYGFTQGEFERAQNDLMRMAEQKYANRNDRRNTEYANVYLENYKKNAPMPDAQTEWQLDSMLIKSLDVMTVNAFTQQLLTPANQVIFIVAPEKEGLVNPTAEEILAIRSKVINSEIEAYADNTVKEPLIDPSLKLKGSAVKKTVVDEKLGTTEWTLKNGIKVVVKPTTLKADEVLINARANGGLTLVSDKEYYMGALIPSLASMSGVGKFSATELRKQLSGKSATLQPHVEVYASAMTGFASPKDFETLLQLLYLQFTQPRFDQNDYNTMMTMMRSQLENAASNPDYKMEMVFSDVAYGKNPRRQTISIEHLDNFSFEGMQQVYNKLYPAANSFVFTIVGNIDLETIRPLVEKYIGSLPVSKQAMEVVEHNAYPVAGEVDHTFRMAMQQPKVSVHYMYSGELENNFKNGLALNFLNQALDARYLISIREEKGGTYGVHVMSDTEYQPTERYTLEIMFDTNDQLADELCQIVVAEIEKIAKEGPNSEDIEKHREFMLKSWKSSTERNGSWMNYIQSKYFSGLDYIGEYEQAVRDLTNADVQAMAKKVLEDGNLVKVLMRPEM